HLGGLPAAGRCQALDGFRGVAMLLVVIHHTRCGLVGGHIGVDLFFVLSGFLITTLLLAEAEKTGRVRLGRFYLARLARLGPALVVTVLWTVIWSGCFDTQASALADGCAVSPRVVTGLNTSRWSIASSGYCAL